MAKLDTLRVHHVTRVLAVQPRDKERGGPEVPATNHGVSGRKGSEQRGLWDTRVTDRAALHDVPPERAVGGLLGQLQEVVQHHLADEVMPREAVEVIDAEVQLALGQLGQGH